MTAEDDEVKGSKTAMRVLSYLSEHPEAQDSLEGILSWWLLDRTIEEQTAEVEAALATLVAAGLVIELTGRDAARRFRLDRRQGARVRELLAEAEEGPDA